MTSRVGYNITRIGISVVLGGLFWLAGMPGWVAVIVALAMLAYFIWVPHSGRYVARFTNDTARLRRDERMQAIRDQAARNAFLGIVLALAAAIVVYGLIVPEDVPVIVLSAILALGTLVYGLSDYWLRRS